MKLQTDKDTKEFHYHNSFSKYVLIFVLTCFKVTFSIKLRCVTWDLSFKARNFAIILTKKTNTFSRTYLTVCASWCWNIYWRDKCQLNFTNERSRRYGNLHIMTNFLSKWTIKSSIILNINATNGQHVRSSSIWPWFKGWQTYFNIFLKNVEINFSFCHP